MSQQTFFEAYGGTGPENYERYFVPAIPAPLAAALVDDARLAPGERVLDVATGTGLVARLAADRVGAAGSVVASDINPGMLAVARSATPPGLPVEWHESRAEDLPFPDGAFDVVLCHLGLQFFTDKAAALREMHRVLAPGGRLAVNVAGPMPALFGVMEEALAGHAKPEAAAFVRVVFSLHDPGELRELVGAAGFGSVGVQPTTRTLGLPSPVDFLWQYVASTPVAGAMGEVDDDGRAALERDIVAGWQEFVEDDALVLRLGVVAVTGRRTA